MNGATQKYSFRLGIYPPVKYLKESLEECMIPEKYRRSAREYIAKHQIISAKRNISSGNYDSAIKFLWSDRYLFQISMEII